MQGTFNSKEYQKKLADALDPNVAYSMEDLLAEFNQGNIISNPNAFKLDINFVNKSDNPDPEYATEGAAGFDLRASEGGRIAVGKRMIVPTGLYFELPPNFEMQIRPRSGLAAKHGVTVLNSPGTIDSDYRGEIKVILINHGEMDFIFDAGERIAQAVIATASSKNVLNLNRVSSISENTERGAGGFGSTGTK